MTVAGLDLRRLALRDHRPEVAVRAGGPPAVLLLHAIGLSWAMWRETMLTFPAGARLIACDLRGHGAAADTPPTSLAQHRDDVCELLDALGVERAHVVGLSYGGAIAQVLALERPERVASLALVATSSRSPAELLRERARAAEADGVAGQIGPTLARWFSPRELADDGPGVRYARAQLEQVRLVNWAAAWRALAELDLSGRLEHVAAPALVVAGEHDAGASPEAMRTTIAAPLSGAHFAIVAGAYHLIALEQPAELAALLAGHLARVSQLR